MAENRRNARGPAFPDQRLYGRHKGHRLRARQAQLVDGLLPKLRVDPEKLPGEGPAGLFARPVDEVWLEIGFGGGEHLAWQARNRHNTGFIGCEPFINGVAKLLATVEAEALDNVRILDGDARRLITALGDQTIARVFLLYPDPWPKKRHNKRRFINQWSLAELYRIMKPGSQLRIASDIPAYITWTLREVRQSGGFEWLAEGPDHWRCRGDDWPGTRYEQKALNEGRTPVYLTFQRRATTLA